MNLKIKETWRHLLVMISTLQKKLQKEKYAFLSFPCKDAHFVWLEALNKLVNNNYSKHYFIIIVNDNNNEFISAYSFYMKLALRLKIIYTKKKCYAMRYCEIIS